MAGPPAARKTRPGPRICSALAVNERRVYAAPPSRLERHRKLDQANVLAAYAEPLFVATPDGNLGASPRSTAHPPPPRGSEPAWAGTSTGSARPPAGGSCLALSRSAARCRGQPQVSPSADRMAKRASAGRRAQRLARVWLCEVPLEHPFLDALAPVCLFSASR